MNPYLTTVLFPYQVDAVCLPQWIDAIFGTAVRKVALADDINTTAGLLEILATSSNDFVMLAVAENRNTPSYTLKALARHHLDGVQRAVATNPNTTGEALAILAKSQWDGVRIQVAKHRNTTDDTLKFLVDQIVQHPTAGQIAKKRLQEG